MSEERIEIPFVKSEEMLRLQKSLHGVLCDIRLMRHWRNICLERTVFNVVDTPVYGESICDLSKEELSK